MRKHIRDTLRLLKRPNLPADIRREQERKLAALQMQATESSKAEKERQMVRTYRMVRFFERKKAERHVKQAQASGSSEQLEAALMDLHYVLNYPKDRKYISLFPTTETTDERVLEERRCIRQAIAHDVMARARVSSVLEAPVPLESSTGSPLEHPGALKAKSALHQGQASSEHYDEDEEDDDEEDDFDDSQDDGEESGSDNEEATGDSESDDLDGDDDDGNGSEEEEGGSDEGSSESEEDGGSEEAPSGSEDEDGEEFESDDDGSDDGSDDEEEDDDEEEEFDSEDDASDDEPAPKRTRK